jgi:outer membrane lipoprotein-sorting protein
LQGTACASISGAALDIRIRGIATNGQNGPTTIIDGKVVLFVKPNIESITVLKDAWQLSMEP